MQLSGIVGQDVPAVPPKKDLICLARNIYYEARGESLEGQIAVTKVVLTRAKSSKYPKDICRVVYQKNQFSWTHNRRNKKYDYNSINAAILAYNEPAWAATHYHTPRVNPRWGFKFIKQIGNHLFYKDET